jgi:hypothetical protein
MRAESARLWSTFLRNRSDIHIYTVDPGAHAIALELVPLVERMGLLAGWFAEGWSARQGAGCRPATDLGRVLGSGQTLIVGSQTDFDRTQSVLRAARGSDAHTIFVFDHWKNFAQHFGNGPLPDSIVVPDEIGERLLVAELGEGITSSVHVLPHLALEAAADRVRSYATASNGNIAVLLDPTEAADDLGYDWRTTLGAMADLAATRAGARVLVKPHPRQDADEVARELDGWRARGVAFELFHGDAERLIAASDEIWGMTTIALNVALAAGKPIRSLQIGRNAKGRSASNPHIEPYALIEPVIRR